MRIRVYKQVIVVNKGLKMSTGKLASQVAHGSMAFLTWMIRNNITLNDYNSIYHNVEMLIEAKLYEQWINGSFTKAVLQVKNENGLQKIVDKAIAVGMNEGKDFFCIRDDCRTELIPDADGKKWTVIGFKPMDSEIIDTVTGKLHLYVD